MRLFGAIEKSEKQSDGSVIIEGIASSEAVDSQGEIITADAMRKALPEWMNWGNIREQHSQNAVGKALFAQVGDDGKTRISAKIVDSEAVKKVLAGVYKGFSVAGEVLSRASNSITGVRLAEVSICDRPVNPECVFSIWKAEKPKQSMDSKFFAKMLGLKEDASEDEISKAFIEKMTPKQPDPKSEVAPELMAAIEKAVKSAAPQPDTTLTKTLETLNKTVGDLQKQSAETIAKAERAERQALIDQAGREGKIVPLENDEIFGNVEKNIAAIPLGLLKSMIAKQQKTVPTGGTARRPIEGDGDFSKLKDEEKAAFFKTAKARAVSTLNDYFAKASNPN